MVAEQASATLNQAGELGLRAQSVELRANSWITGRGRTHRPRGGRGRDSDRDGNWEIYVMDADGSDQTNLTSSPGNDLDPAWLPK